MVYSNRGKMFEVRDESEPDGEAVMESKGKASRERKTSRKQVKKTEFKGKTDLRSHLSTCIM